MTERPNPNTELGLMQMLADADREAQEQFAAWMVDFRGRLGKPPAQPQQPPAQVPPPQGQVNYG